MNIPDEFSVHGQVLFFNGNSQSTQHLRSYYFSGLGLQNLKRIEVIADDEAEIVEAVRRMSSNYDFVVTSGGIGPT